MSNIRQYLKNKKNGREEYEKKIVAHRNRNFIIIASIGAIIVLATIVIKIYLDNQSFDSYEIDNIMEGNNGGNSLYYQYGEGLLFYSDDGIAYISDGVTIWNKAFEMKKPIIDVCENMMAVCDQGTTTVYIYSTEGQQGKIETVYPIIDLEVSEQGVIGAVTQDSDTNRIEVMDKDGNSIAVGQTYITGEGCPIDITLSNDGTKLAAAYVYIDGGKAKSKVVFYNYSEVGKNEVSRIVGGFNHYEDTIVSRVEFLDNDTVVAYGDSLFTLYAIKQKPQMIEEVKIDKKIKSIFYSDKYVGMILNTEDYSQPYEIRLYDLDGDLKTSQTTDFIYTGIELKNESLIIYNTVEMMLMTATGNIRYRGNIEEGIYSVIPTSRSDRYYVINDEKNIMKIILK